MSKILVTGAHGQLGSELNFLASLKEDGAFSFFDRQSLDIYDVVEIDRVLESGDYAYVINCAAYTAVDKAESEAAKAYQINADGAGNLAAACKKYNVRLLHVSTDFIFDGTIGRPLQETDAPNPLSVYGSSKLKGEELVMARNADAIILRTSWVYSSFGTNFVKTILRLCKERETLNVIYDQVGTPTYARDLAAFILQLVGEKNWVPGIYNYSNEGVCSWYDFAIAIRDNAGLRTKINPILTKQYPTPATRPLYSVLNKAKVKETFAIEIPYWRESLLNCMKLLA